jgi:DeoR family fructose operon transcriptional repressor
MYAVERRQQIVDVARRDGRVTVIDLAHHLNVAQETVRRDLADLETQGLVTRVHGGALPADRIGFEGDVSSRRARNPEEKSRIAQRALGEIQDAETIYLDEGSTTALLARALDPDRQLTVVTASVPVVLTVHTHPRITVLLLGGVIRRRSIAASGELPSRMLREMVIDVAFLGTNGITLQHGLTCPDLGVAAVKRAAIAGARRSVLLTDSTKFGLDSFAAFAKITDVHTVITGSAAPRRTIEAIRQQHVQVILA